MKRVVRNLVARTADSTAFSRLVQLVDRWSANRADVLHVLTYHRVEQIDAAPQLDPSLLSATPAAFAAQMEYLAKHFRPVSIDRVLRAFAGHETLPRRAVLITFDDAYRCFAEHAWPVLKRLDLPTVMFVPTGYPDRTEHGLWWDRVHHAIQSAADNTQLVTSQGSWSIGSADDRLDCVRTVQDRIRQLSDDRAQALVDEICERLRPPTLENQVLSWHELRALQAEGVTLAPHTRSHPLLTRVSLATAREEAATSRDDLLREIGSAPPILSYPEGAWNQAIAEALGSDGVQLAFTTQRGRNDLGRSNPLALRRINVGLRASVPLLHAQMLPAARLLHRFA